MNDSEKRRIQNQFHAYCVTVLKNEARRIQREYTRRRELEKSLEDLTSSEQEQTAVADRYFTDEHVFEVQGLPVVVTGDLLADALAKLPEGKRNVILLSYFLDLNGRTGRCPPGACDSGGGRWGRKFSGRCSRPFQAVHPGTLHQGPE